MKVLKTVDLQSKSMVSAVSTASVVCSARAAVIN